MHEVIPQALARPLARAQADERALLQGPSDLCFRARIERFARLGRPDKMTDAVGIDRARSTLDMLDLLQ
jgi:hypothetical protein